MVPLKVAVIGAGAAGLAALRHLAKKPELFHPIAFEQSFSVGGTWVYTEKTSKDEYGSPIHSSMYKNLRTNLPTQVMAFPDFPFRSDLPSFIMHTDMRNYLEDYTDHFNIREYIQFGTSVERVHPTKKAEVTIWEITTRKVDQNKFEHWEFDMVMICNGHYSKPLLPNIPGMKEFQGTIIHSHNYRDPEAFRGKTVACLGAGSSGQDITLDVARCAKQVYICHRRPQLVSPFPPNVEQKVGGIKSLTEKGFIGEDEKFTEIDVLLLCTGYKYDFPFLTPECSVSTDDERVVPLYKHIIHINWPTLSFIGIPKVICPFPLFDCQIQFVLAVENGRMKLPTQEEMYCDMQKDFERRLENGFPVRHAHHMGKLQWGYNDELAKLSDFAPIPRVVGKLYDHVHHFRVTDLPGYKRKNFEIIDTENFRETGI